MIADREYEILTSLVDYANNNCGYFTNKIILIITSNELFAYSLCLCVTHLFDRMLHKIGAGGNNRSANSMRVSIL